MSELNISKCKIKINIKKIKRSLKSYFFVKFERKRCKTCKKYYWNACKINKSLRNILMESLQHIKCQNKVLGNAKKTCTYYNKIV